MHFFFQKISEISAAEEGLEVVDLRVKNGLKRGYLGQHIPVLPSDVSAPTPPPQLRVLQL